MCDGDEWRCFNLRCVSRRRLCDGVDDCGDASDESYTHARCPGECFLPCEIRVRVCVCVCV